CNKIMSKAENIVILSRKGHVMVGDRIRTPRGTWLLMVAALLVAVPASANDFDLLLRAPGSANALILINVEKLMNTPLSLRDKWKEKQGTADRPGIELAPDAKSMLLVSKINYVGQWDTDWDLALIESTHDISIPLIARAEGGYVDKVEGVETAFSPRNAFMV